MAHTPFNFLVDLLAIEVPQLFAQQQQSDSDHYSEFSTHLEEYVSGGHIEEKVPLILVSYYTVIYICFMHSLAFTMIPPPPELWFKVKNLQGT